MYCKHCASEMDPNAAVCLHCGYAAGRGEDFCPNCGQGIGPKQLVCPYCGASTHGASMHGASAHGAPCAERPAKSRVAAGIFGILLGAFGVHNFYLGYTGKAVAQLLLTLLICGAGSVISGTWGLIEGIMILSGKIGCDAFGVPMEE